MPRPYRLAPLVALGCLAGCLSPRTASNGRGLRGDTVLVHEAKAPPPGEEMGAEARAACGLLLSHNRRLIATAPGPKPSGELDYEKACFPVKGGAWGLRLLEWQSDENGWEGAMRGRYELVYVRDGLAPKAAALPASFDELAQGIHSAELAPPRLFDFDGDGEPEIFLRRHAREHEGPDDDEGLLLAWREGDVRPYPGLPAKYDRLDDVDQDGRPDVIYYPYAEERESPCSGFGYTWLGPAFVAHSLKGGAFSNDDGVARDFVKRACPSRPAPGRPAPEGDADGGADAPPELCARVWGASEAEALALLKRQCKPPPPPEPGCEVPTGVCHDYEGREAALKKAPPLVVRE